MGWSYRARLIRDGTRAETRFHLSEKWSSPFKSAVESVQSTAGSRGVRISGQIMDRPCSEVQCKSSGYPLHSPISPSLPLQRVTVCHHVSNGLCLHRHVERPLPLHSSYEPRWCNWIATRLRAGGSTVRIALGVKIFLCFFSKRADPLWGPASFVVFGGRGAKLTSPPSAEV